MAAEYWRRLRAANPVDERRLELPELAELEAGWSDVAVSASPVTVADVPRRRGLWAGGGLASFAVAGLVAAGAAAAALTAVTGDPLGRVPSVEVQAPRKTQHLAGVTAKDPEGGPAWTVRVGRVGPDIICLNVGQRIGQRFGLVGLDGTFRSSAVDGADECAVRPRGPAVLLNGRTLVGRTSADTISVLYGAVAARPRTILLSVRGAPARRIAVDSEGVFVAVERGALAKIRPTLTVGQFRDKNGSFAVTRGLRLGASYSPIVNGQPPSRDVTKEMP